MEKIANRNPENRGHYSAGVISRGILYVSGQLAVDPLSGSVPAGGIDVHVRQALANVDWVLSEAGLTRNTILLCRVYITNLADWDVVNRVFASFFGDHKPARVVVPVTGLHFGSLVEIEALAEFPA